MEDQHNNKGLSLDPLAIFIGQTTQELKQLSSDISYIRLKIDNLPEKENCETKHQITKAEAIEKVSEIANNKIKITAVVIGAIFTIFTILNWLTNVSIKNYISTVKADETIKYDSRLTNDEIQRLKSLVSKD